MSAREKWNDLVKHYKENVSSSEEIVQRDWESFLTDSAFFGYSKNKGDVDPHRSLQIGSSERVVPDIIVRKDNRDIFVVELKKYSLPFSKGRAEQLFSYLKLLHVSIGILVCDKIYIYVYDFAASEQENWLEIPFKEDHADGIAFFELFSKETFEKEKIIEFISNKKSFEKNVSKIKNQINNEFVYNLVKNYFLGEYTSEEVENALANCSFSFAFQAVEKQQEFHTELEIEKIKTKGYTNTEYSNERFWTKFNEYAFSNSEFQREFTMRKPTKRHWYDFSIGVPKCHIAITHLKEKIGVEIYIPDYKPLYDLFFLHKEEIEAAVGKTLSWQRLPGKKAARVLITTSQFNMSDESYYEKEFDWIIDHTLKFKKAFKKFC